jgi:hypothetical protein
MDKVPHAENLCGSFWWKDVLKQVDNFRGVAVVNHGAGDSFLFWSDNWNINGMVRPLKDRFPRLFSFVLNENISAAKVYEQEDILNLFYRPLSVQAFEELGHLKDMLQLNPLTDNRDVWSYCWGETYKPALFYKHIHKHIQVPMVYSWLWKSCCMMKLKVFAWLLLSDRLNTRDLLQRRHWNVTDDTHCELCPARSYEHRIHLFFECNFSVRVWNYLQVEWVPNNDLQTIVEVARAHFAKPFFMEVLIVACWNIWLIKNGKIFNKERPSFTRWRCRFVHDISLLQYRIKDKHKKSLLDWVKALP